MQRYSTIFILASIAVSGPACGSSGSNPSGAMSAGSAGMQMSMAGGVATGGGGQSSGGRAGDTALAGGGVGGSVGGTAGAMGEPGIHYVGRMDSSTPDQPRFAWSGSGAVLRFSGTEVSVAIEDGGENWMTVVIDGAVQDPLTLEQGSQTYSLATGLAAGEHTVELYRRTEASFGPTQFHGFDFGDGELLSPPPAPERRIEFIGDSITCGYGNEGESESCPFSADTENHYLTYGAITARTLQAEASTVAWSGKGIIYNYGDNKDDPLPSLYDRAIPSEAGSSWDFAWKPDAVVINLGTNDFSTDDDPTPTVFENAYVAFLTHIREMYPDAIIVCTVGTLLGGDDLTAARAGIQAAVNARNGAGDTNVVAWEMNVQNTGFGCSYHPSLTTHQDMADALVAELKTVLGW